MKEEKQELLIFAGTTEGRILAEFATGLGISCHVCVATEYGGSLLQTIPGLKVHIGRMDQSEMEAWICAHPIQLVVDATHPYAVKATKHIQTACQRTETPYIRCLRGGSEVVKEETGHLVVVESVPEAVEFLKQTEGNILIATGSKELKEYARIEGYRKRCFARVLSTKEAVSECAALGLEGNHLIAMQGPFSKELNVALLRHVDATWFVTKESGKTGGFQEKVEAAKEAEAHLVVIGRPEEQGQSLEEVKAWIAGHCLAEKGQI